MMKMCKVSAGAAALFILGCAATWPLAALDPGEDVRHYGHRSWQAENGLPQNTVRAVLQSRDGYLWLGTDGGLVRFDGNRFVVYDRQSTPGLQNNVVNCLFEDRSGDLWVGTADGLARRRGSEFTTFTSADGLPGNDVSSIYQDRDGRIWALASEGVAWFDGRGWKAIGGAPLAGATSMGEASDGTIWFGTDHGAVSFSGGKVKAGASRLETRAIVAGPDGRLWLATRAGVEVLGAGAQPSLLTQAKGLPSDDVTALLADRGRVWVGTVNGLALVEGGRVVRYGVKEGLPGARIQALYADREGAIWISTNRGMARFAGGRLEPFGQQQGLSGDTVLAMLEDREGSLWMGTQSGGLTVLHDQKFTTYTAANGLPEDVVRSVYQDGKGTVWVGTDGGGLDRVDQRPAGAQGAAHPGSLSTAMGLSSNIVLALADDGRGSLWIGTPDGLNRLRDGQITTYTSADGLADDFVRSLYTAPDGSLWIGTRRGLSRLEAGSENGNLKARFTSYTTMDGLGSNLVGALLQGAPTGPEAGLWVGTLGGLSRLQGERFVNLTTRHGLSSDIVTALHQDGTGTLWIGTSGGGLDRLRGGVVTAFSGTATGLPENIYAILEDGRKNLWLSSDKGVFKVAIGDLDAFAAGTLPRVRPALYGTADGMAIAECSSGGHPSAWRLRDGTLAFATLKGVAMIDPERSPVNSVAPPVAIEQLTFDDRPVRIGATVTLPPGQGRLAIDYTGISFIAPQKVRFRYRLEGFDHDWVEAGARRTAFYTNIPPGRYRFRVLACNNDGVWNETGAALDFRLSPHFYQTSLFYVLAILTAALMGYGLYRQRVRGVQQQFGMVLAERGRIAREIHDTLAQSLVAISVQLEVVSRLLPATAERAREHLDHARGLTRSSLTEARSSIWDLRSDGTGAAAGARVEDLASSMSAIAANVGAGTSIKIQSKVGGAYHPLPAKLESELLRIAQEAATNAVRHAQPRTILIDLQFGARLLTMTIVDDGRGFSGQPHPQASGPGGHFGLTGMRERAEEIGGRFAVESAPGKGTSVRVDVPID